MPETSPQIEAILSDRYRIEKQIGQGGMATVYLAHDVKLEREVALKVLRPELGAVLGTERFLAEVKITARLDHPHILTLIDSGAAAGFLYYVLPYVRGESLRDLLDREHQLGIEQALAITKHIASALDYAHRKGVVHRDIKPENILLQEGEAMLADFGIALAVKESAGNRLTETGLSLGTPHYMSPEQATGDRDVDARSDLYSLASVLYEMLVGEPPMTGKTVQAVVAKLLTETPMHVRTVRPTVADHVDAAIAKALSKVPADRFATVAEFLRALETPSAVGPGASQAMPSAVAAAAPSSGRRMMLVGAAVVALGAIGVLASGKLKKVDTSATLKDRTQLTFSGKVWGPTLSQDGKQLATFVKECKGADCTYALEVQDVGSTNSRRVLAGATSGYGLEWSPDRRNLIMFGTINGRYGSYLISALGGEPRFLTAGPATFYAGGDSLLLGAPGVGESFTVRIAGLDGAVRDSIKVPGPGQGLGLLATMPGSNRIVAMVFQNPHGLWQLLDRSGTVTDKLVNACTCGAAASHDALWMTRAGPTITEAVVRVAVDSATGKFSTHQDTIYNGRFTNVSVTADGTRMTVDDGSYTYNVLAADLPALFKGTVPQGAPTITASNNLSASLSPDGKLLAVRRRVPVSPGVDEHRLAFVPFAGGAEVPVNVTTRPVLGSWLDSTTFLVGMQQPGGMRITKVDARTGTATGAPLEVPDSAVISAVPLSDGWAWIPKTGDKVILTRGGKTTEVPKPAGYSRVLDLHLSRDGQQILVGGYGGATDDTTKVAVMPAAGGPMVTWGQGFAESAYSMWANDGAALMVIWVGTEKAVVHRITGPGKDETLGTVQHLARGLSLSADLKRAVVNWTEYRGDAWMHRVVKP